MPTEHTTFDIWNLIIDAVKEAPITLTPKTITGITAADPPVVTSTAHGLADGDVVYIDGVAGMVEVNGGRYTLANKNANDFELSGIVGAGYTAYVSGGIAQQKGTAAGSKKIQEWMDRRWRQERDKLLRLHDWNFAMNFDEITVDATEAPDASGWANRFAVPAGTLRVLPITEEGEFNGTPVPHRVVSANDGEWIYTDHGGPIRVRTVNRRTDPLRWEPLFVDTLVLQIGIKLGVWLTNKASILKQLREDHAEAEWNAERMDEQEGTPEDVDQDDVISVRG